MSISHAYRARMQAQGRVVMPADVRTDLGLEEGEELILRAYMSEDFREGMDAFLNKRAPNWKGR